MTILTYHAIDQDWTAPLSVPPALFERHLDWIEANRRVVTLEATSTATVSNGLAGDEVVITFDDGFTSVADHALPGLIARGMPATVFVVGKMLDGSGGQIDWVDRPPPHRLSVFHRDQILDLHRSGVGFGCHSYAHRDLTKLGYDACLEDLRRARGVLEDLLGEPVRTLAYPFGKHDADVRRAAADAGFTWAYAMATPPRASGPHAVPRVGVYPNDDIARLKMKTHTWYGRLRSSPAYPALHRLRAALRSGRSQDRPEG